MRGLFFLSIALLLAGCETFTKDAQKLDIEASEARVSLANETALAIEGSNYAISLVPETPELRLALDFNHLALASTGVVLNYEQTRGMHLFADDILAGNETAINRFDEKLLEVTSLRGRLGAVEGELNELKSTLYSYAQAEETRRKETFWGRIMGWVGLGWNALIIGGIIYLLAITGLLPLIIKFVAGTFPKMIYSVFGLVRKEVAEKLVVAVGEYRKEQKEEVQKGDQEAEKRLKKLDEKLKSNIVLTSKDKDLVDKIRKNKGY